MGSLVQVAGITITGSCRSDNQDAVVINHMVGMGGDARLNGAFELNDALVCGVVDGMGGYAGGADAAAIVAAGLAKGDLVPDDAADMINKLSHKVAQAGCAWGMPSMGAAMATVRITEGSAFAVNVGDCRIYRAYRGQLGLLSVDDRNAVDSNAITQAMGSCVDVDCHGYNFALDDLPCRLILCSDGVWGCMSHGELKRHCADLLCSPQVTAQAIIDASLVCGSSDNCSVVVADIHEGGQL